MSLSASPIQTGKMSYDRITIMLHWLTAALVIFLFASAETWGFLPRGGDMRHALQSLHVSCGILLLPVILFRLIWRLAHRGDLPPAAHGLQEVLARGIHGVLYLLLVVQVCLGFLFRWAQGEEFGFFGLFSVPHVFDIDASLRRPIGEFHEYVAWAIIILAGFHAVAALFHHYVLKDRVLSRMVPHAAKSRP